MKKILIPVIALAFACTSCEDCLDAKNIFSKDLTTFYSTPTEITEAMAGMYAGLYTQPAESYEIYAANMVGDIMMSGGEPGGSELAYEMDQMIDPRVDTHAAIWKDSYGGIYRANALIERLSEENKGLDTYFSNPEEKKAFLDHIIGEAYFVRGYLYLRLGRYFGGVPLILKTDANRQVPRNTYEETFAQAISDFKTSLDYLPVQAASAYPSDWYGRSNRWISEGYLARAWMHYTGYMTNIEGVATTSITLPDGSVVAKADVVAYLDDCIANSGYGLLDDPRELWPYSAINDMSALYGGTGNDLPWASAQNIHWAGQDGFTSEFGYGNKESMFSITCGLGAWGSGNDGDKRSNRMNQYFSVRDQGGVPFGQGWGHGQVNTAFIEDWKAAEPNDIRRDGSIYRLGDAEFGAGAYKMYASTDYTGYMNTKYCNLDIQGEKGVGRLFRYMFGSNIKMASQLSNAQDMIMLRFADVLLMHDELTETNTGMTQLRARAGLEEVPYTLENLKKERLYELVFEGSRWFDLVRWGDVYNGNNYYGREITVYNNFVEDTYTLEPNPAQKGLFPFPETEISIANGLYEPNPGWE